MQANHQRVITAGEIRDRVWHSTVLYTSARRNGVNAWQAHVFGISSNADLALANACEITQPDLVQSDSTLHGVYYTTSKFIHADGREDNARQSDFTRVRVGKNLRRVNATSALSQAASRAASLWLARERKGASTSPNISAARSFTELHNAGKHRVRPMALHNLKDHWARVEYPAWVQPKYDGTRILAVYSELCGLCMWTRGGKDYNIPHLRSELETLLRKHPQVYLDGELWSPGHALQNISGNARRENEQQIMLQFWAFDCFKIEPEPWPQRLQRLQHMFADDYEYVKLVPTHCVQSREQVMAYFTEFIAQDYEGLVLRRNAEYEYGITREMRSYNAMKLKPHEDDEWILLDWTQGSTGRDVRALLFRLCTTPELQAQHAKKYNRAFEPLQSPQQGEFTAAPAGEFGNYESRRAAVRWLETRPQDFKAFRNAEITVQFSTLSNLGKPQQPKVLRFRDAALQAKFMRGIAEYV